MSLDDLMVGNRSGMVGGYYGAGGGMPLPAVDDGFARKRRVDDGPAGPPMGATTIKVARRIYVGNLAFNTTGQALKDHFKTAGEVINAEVLTEPGTARSKGCGIVEFATSEEAARAIEQLDETELDGRKVYVREDREDPDLKEHLGDRPRFRKFPRRGGYYGGYGRGMPGRGGGGYYGAPDAPAVVGRRLYVNNLSYDTSWQDLKDHFRQAGMVVHADILTGYDGRSKGCGIVEYQNSMDAMNAINQLNNTILKGRPILVREDREEMPQGGGHMPPAYQPYGAAPDPMYGAAPDYGAAGYGYGATPYDPTMAAMSYGAPSYAAPHGGPPMGMRGGRPQLDGRDLASRQIHPSRAVPPKNPAGCQVVVHGIPFEYAWQELSDLMRTAGRVVHTDIMRDPDGRSKGYGTALFETPTDALNAIAKFHGTELQGRILTVKLDKFLQ